MEMKGGSRHLQPAPLDVQPGGGEPGTSIIMSKPMAEPGHHSPSPLVWLICCANEATAVVGCGDDGTGGYWVPNICPN